MTWLLPSCFAAGVPLRRELLFRMLSISNAGMLGVYGFYEAVDFTPARLAAGQEMAIVRSYMATIRG